MAAVLDKETNQQMQDIAGNYAVSGMYTHLRDVLQALTNNQKALRDRVNEAKLLNELAVLLREMGYVKKDPYGNPMKLVVEAGGGGQNDVDTSFNGIDPLEALKKISEAAPNIALQILWRTDKGVGYVDGEPALNDDTMKAHRYVGVQVIRPYSYSNYLPEYFRSFEQAKILYKEDVANGVPEIDRIYIDAANSVTEARNLEELDSERVWPISESAEHNVKLIQYGYDPKIDRNIVKVSTAKDAIGVFNDVEKTTQRFVVYKDAINKAKEENRIDIVPELRLHSHGDIPEIQAALYKIGVNSDIASGHLSGKTSHTDILKTLRQIFKNEGFSDKQIDSFYKKNPIIKKLIYIEKLVDGTKFKHEEYLPDDKLALTRKEILDTGVGGGAASAFIKQIRDKYSAEGGKDKLGVTLKQFRDLSVSQAEYFYKALGEPETLTPYSKNAGDNATDSAMTLIKAKRELQQLGESKNGICLGDVKNIVLQDIIKHELKKMKISAKDKNYAKQGIKISYIEGKLNEYKTPPLSTWNAYMIGHACSDFGEMDRGCKSGKGDKSLRDAALYGRTFDLTYYSAANTGNIVKKLIKAGNLTNEQAEFINKQVSRIKGVKELKYAFNSSYGLDDIRNSSLNTEQVLNKICGCVENIYRAEKISKPARDALLESLLPGKSKVLKISDKDREKAESEVNSLIKSTLNEFKKDGIIPGIYKEILKKDNKLNYHCIYSVVGELNGEKVPLYGIVPADKNRIKYGLQTRFPGTDWAIDHNELLKNVHEKGKRGPRYQYGIEKANEIAKYQVEQYEKYGMPITLPLIDKDDKRISEEWKMNIPGDKDKVINLFHVAIGIASGQQNRGELLYSQFLYNGDRAGTKIVAGYYEKDGLKNGVDHFKDMKDLVFSDINIKRFIDLNSKLKFLENQPNFSMYIDGMREEAKNLSKFVTRDAVFKMLEEKNMDLHIADEFVEKGIFQSVLNKQIEAGLENLKSGKEFVNRLQHIDRSKIEVNKRKIAEGIVAL